MNVWVMTLGYDYEGEDVVGVYASLEGAQAVETSGNYQRTSEWRLVPHNPDSGIWIADTDSGSVSLYIYPFEVQP